MEWFPYSVIHECEFMEVDSCLIQSWFTAPSVSASINVSCVLVRSSAGRDAAAVMWTGATAAACFRARKPTQLHSGPQLPLSLPIGLPKSGSGHRSPEQVLLCLGLLTQNLISIKEQLKGIRPVLSQLPVLHRSWMLNQCLRHPGA